MIIDATVPAVTGELLDADLLGSWTIITIDTDRRTDRQTNNSSEIILRQR